MRVRNKGVRDLQVSGDTLDRYRTHKASHIHHYDGLERSGPGIILLHGQVRPEPMEAYL